MTTMTEGRAPDWKLWQAMLDGESTEGIEVGDGILHQGFFHDRYFAPVAIWYVGEFPNGSWVGMIGDKKTSDLTALDRAMSRVLQAKGGGCAVPKEQWVAKVRDKTPFPEEAAKLAERQQEKAAKPVTLEDFTEVAHEAESTFLKFVDKVGGEVHNGTEYELFSKLYARCIEVGKACDDERKRLKKPLDEAVAEVQNAWQPVVNRIKNIAEKSRSLGQRWQNAERARIEREHAEAVAAAKAKGEMPPEPEKREVGAIKSRKPQGVAQIDDWESATLFLARMNDRPAEFVRAVEVCLTRCLLAGVSVPGAKLVNKE